MRKTQKGLPADGLILPDSAKLQVSAGVHYNDGYHVRGYLTTEGPKADGCKIQLVASNGSFIGEIEVTTDVLPVLGALVESLHDQAKRNGLVPSHWPKRPHEREG